MPSHYFSKAPADCGPNERFVLDWQVAGSQPASAPPPFVADWAMLEEEPKRDTERRVGPSLSPALVQALQEARRSSAGGRRKAERASVLALVPRVGPVSMDGILRAIELGAALGVGISVLLWL
jgi:hypothetical protein